MFSDKGGQAGIFQASGYQLFNDEREEPSYKDIIYQFKKLSSYELKLFEKDYKYGYFCTTICVDARIHMKYLTDKFVFFHLFIRLPEMFLSVRHQVLLII